MRSIATRVAMAALFWAFFLPLVDVAAERLPLTSLAEGCRGYLVMTDTRLVRALWIEGQPSEGFVGNPKVCCGLCQHMTQCRGWTHDRTSGRCWLHVAKHSEDSFATRRAVAYTSGIHTAALRGMIAGVGTSVLLDKNEPHSGSVLNTELITELNTLPPIPQKLHIIFPDKSVVTSKSAMAQHGVARMIELNPGWSWKVYDDEELNKYIAGELTRPDPLLTPRDVQLILNANVIEKTDAARLLLLWREGGFYQDVDRVYNVPMAEALRPQVKMVLPIMGSSPPNFMQDVMCTSPGNPIVRRSLELGNLLRRAAPRVNGSVSADMTLKIGQTWGTAIRIELFGISHFKSAQEWTHAYADLQGIPAIQVSNESWCDGLWVRPYKQCRRVGRQELYKEFNVSYWHKHIAAQWLQHCDGLRAKRALVESKSGLALKRIEDDLKKYACSAPSHQRLTLPPALHKAVREKASKEWLETEGRRWGLI